MLESCCGVDAKTWFAFFFCCERSCFVGLKIEKTVEIEKGVI